MTESGLSIHFSLHPIAFARQKTAEIIAEGSDPWPHQIQPMIFRVNIPPLGLTAPLRFPKFAPNWA